MENLLSTLENWSVKSESELSSELTEQEDYVGFEPIILSRRLVLRNQILAPVDRLVSFHKLIKDDCAKADSAVDAIVKGEMNDPLGLFKYCCVRSIFEE